MTPEAMTPTTCAAHGAYDSMRFTFGGRQLWSGCPTCDAEKLRTRAAELTQEHLREIRQTRQCDAMIPLRFTGKTLADFEGELPGQRKARRVAERYLEKWRESRALGRCLIFHGWPGTGKSLLAATIVQAVVAAGGRALFRSVPDAVAIVKAAYDGGTTEAAAYQRLRAPDLLVLDDVGAVKLSEHDVGVLFRVLNARYEDQRPTILTTNLTTTELAAFLGDRITDRLRDHGGMAVPFEWESCRK